MAKARPKQTECVHWWIIDSSHHGICKYCGAKRDFPCWEDLVQREYSTSKPKTRSSRNSRQGTSPPIMKARSGPPRYDVIQSPKKGGEIRGD